MMRRLAGWLANSRLLRRGKAVYAQNCRDWDMPLSKVDKLLSGAYLILNDYSTGAFPPTFQDQAAAYAAEVNFRSTLPGVDSQAVRDVEMRKPFWFGRSAEYLAAFTDVMRALEQQGIAPPARLLELGCGTGWMAEFLATAGFDVTGTSIAPADIEDARTRVDSLRAKNLDASLRFEVAAMETVHEVLGTERRYDAVFVFEALHHAFDWRATIRSAYQCLGPGGVLLICNEPNVLHTLIAYRVARLSNTHEVGFRKGSLLRELRRTGFASAESLRSPFHFWVSPHWIAARKGADSLAGDTAAVVSRRTAGAIER